MEFKGYKPDLGRKISAPQNWLMERNDRGSLLSINVYAEKARGVSAGLSKAAFSRGENNDF